MFSVIIPLYNKERSIGNAIQSVLNQTLQDFEIIVINDGSTDDSLQIVKRISDPRIRVISKPNGGVSSARNRGIIESKRDWITFLDADDWWSADFLSVMSYLKDRYPDAGIWAGQYVQVNKKNEHIKLNRFPKIEEGYFKLCNHLYAVWSSSILLSKNIFEECGYFDENLTHGEDTDMWIRIGMKYPICYTNRIVAYYNIADNPLTKSTGKIPIFERHLLSKIDDYLGIGGSEWDDILNYRKAIYLRTFYLQYPTNKKIKLMVANLSIEIKNKKEFRIFKANYAFLLLRHSFLMCFQKCVKLKNQILLRL